MLTAHEDERAGHAAAGQGRTVSRRAAERPRTLAGARTPRGTEIALKTAAATAVFAAVHSLLASERAKQRAVRLTGRTSGEALYRAFYNVQAVVSFAMLLRYGSRLPATVVYHVHGPRARLLRCLQAAGVAWALWAVREVGIARLSGADTASAYSRGRASPPPPAAQGPEQDARGRLTRGGPFRWSRHPLNLAPLPVFWATPHMTFRRLGFNLVATAYLVVGSFHEERRLARRYGERYEMYRRSAPLYLPCPPPVYRMRKTIAQTLRTTIASRLPLFRR